MKKLILSALALVGMGAIATETDAQFYVVKDGRVIFSLAEGTADYIAFENPNKYEGTIGTPVDLGLPSGTLWADHNIGATNAHDAGSYYAWGEITTKDVYNWSTYEWMDHSIDNWNGCTKYTFEDEQTGGVWYDSEGKFIGDNKKELEDVDDVAVQTWGAGWAMPTHEQMQELVEKCEWEWTTLNEVPGYKVKSKAEGNDNSIFLPAAGYRWTLDTSDVGSYGYYWSRSLNSDYSGHAWDLSFLGGYSYGLHAHIRYGGFPVRPVLRSSALNHC